MRIDAHSQLRSEFTLKLNQLWARLFYIYGLQLHYIEDTYFPKWKKYFIMLLPRLFVVLFTIRYLILTAKLNQLEVFVILGPPTIFNTITTFTAFFLQKNETDFSALYKILLDLTLKSPDAIKRIKRNIYTSLIITATFNVAYYIVIIKMLTTQSHKYLEFNVLIYNEFNSRLLRIYLLAETVFNVIFHQMFLGITVMYFSYMCKVLELAFKDLNEDIERAIVSTSELTNAKLSGFRRRYQYLSQIVEKISKSFSPLLFFWLVGLIFIFCLRIRSFKPYYEFPFRVHTVLDTCHLIYLVIVIFKNSSELQAQSSKMKGRVSELIISDDELAASTNQERISINCLLFSQTLNADNVGVSVSGLFILSTFSFLNMASTVITYVVLVYQS
uniref:Gustatory receptor n=1 Tax=Strigamia maritima TaxID=126957 RepID=T1JMK1_STRMM